MTAPEFKHTMKVIVSPGGRIIPAIRASARRTGGKGCTGWPTPQANKNTKNSKDPQRMKENGAQTCLADAAHLAGWPTPQAHDTQEQGQAREMTATGRIKTHTGSDVSANLPMVAGWATPRAEDAESAGMRHGRGVADTLSAQAGQDAARSSAATEKPAAFRLNPRFSLWLMGYPAAWASCGERAMQSCQKSRRRS